MRTLMEGLYFSPDKGKEDEADSTKGDTQKTEDQKTEDILEELQWDTWFNELPKEAQGLIKTRESGLKTALSSERDARKTAEKDLRDVADKLEKGSDAQKKVLELADAVADGSKKADFYEDAHGAGVTNLKLAFLAAKEGELFDRRGVVDFVKLKELHPELFSKKKVGEGGAGEGTGGGLPGKKPDMNVYIRTAAGKAKS